MYILSVKEWEGLKDTLQEKVGSISTKIREYHCKDNSKGDVVTKWDENKYVIVAIDNGHETSTITKRLMKNIESEIEGDLLSVTLLFGAASYPVEGKTFEELLRKSQNQLYQYRNLQENE